MIRLRTLSFAAVLLTVLFSPCLVSAGPNSSSTDEIFVTKAARGGLAEVADGRLALADGSNASVRAIGQRMVTDHSKANRKLTTIARADALVVPALPDATDRAMMAKQKMLTGSDFDKSYLDGQVAAHQKTIDLFKTEITQGSNPQLIAFAKQTLPTIEMHLKMIQSALDSM